MMARIERPLGWSLPTLSTYHLGKAVQLGFLKGTFGTVKFGKTPDIGIGSAPLDIHGATGAYTGQPTGAAEAAEILFNSAGDTAAGTGARSVQVWGLDENGLDKTETVASNGGTQPLSGLWTRIFRGAVLTAGSNETNLGSITCRHQTTTTNVFFELEAGAGQTDVAAYTVPSNCIGLITSYKFTLARANGAAGSAEVSFKFRDSGGAWRRIVPTRISDGSPGHDKLEIPFFLKPGTDVKGHIDTISDNNSAITCAFGIWIIETDEIFTNKILNL